MRNIIVSVAIIFLAAAPLYARSMQYESQAKHEKRNYDYIKQQSKANWKEEQYRNQKAADFMNDGRFEETKTAEQRIENEDVLLDEAGERAVGMSGGDE